VKVTERFFTIKGFNEPFQSIQANREEAMIFGFPEDVKWCERYYGAINSRALVYAKDWTPLFRTILKIWHPFRAIFKCFAAAGRTAKEEFHVWKSLFGKRCFYNYSWVDSEGTAYLSVKNKVEFNRALTLKLKTLNNRAKESRMADAYIKERERQRLEKEKNITPKD